MFYKLLKKYSIKVIAIICCTFEPVFAQSSLVITQGTRNTTTIAVVPFSSQNTLPEDITAIVSTDLYYSGEFVAVNRNKLISSPAVPNEVISRDFRALGAEYILLGHVNNSGTLIDITYYLINVNSGQTIIANKITGKYTQTRDLAHTISDHVFEHLTGLKGAFRTKILYVNSTRLTNGRYQYLLMRADYDGARPVTIMRSPEPILSPNFAPDGKSIAYVSFETKRPRIYLHNLQTGKRYQVTNFAGLNNAPAFSPDGNKLAFVLSKDGNPELYMIDLRNHQLTRLTKSNSIETEPFWGKDNKTIYFTSDRTGSPQIYRININNGNTERVSFIGNYNANPKLSADETHLVMVHRQKGFTGYRIGLLNLYNSQFKTISTTELDESSTISPNGAMIIYATRVNGRSALILASTNGRVKNILPIAADEVREPTWSGY